MFLPAMDITSILVYSAVFLAAGLIANKAISFFSSSKNSDTFPNLLQQGPICAPPTNKYPHHPLLFRIDLFLEIANDVLHRRFTEGVRRRFDRYGKTFVAKLAYRDIVCTIDPENLRSFMSTRFDDWTIIANRRKLIRVMLGDGVFSTEGEEWRHSRAMIGRAMKGVDLGFEMLERHVQRLLAGVRAEAGGKVDLGALINEYTMGTAGEIVLGPDDSDEGEQFRSDFAYVGRMAREMTIFIKSIPYLGQMMFGKSFTETRTRVLAYADKAMAKTNPPSRDGTQPLLHSLSTLEPNPIRSRSEALNLLLAGRDTTGIGLSELFYLLARHPSVWAKLRAEIRSSNPTTIHELQQMPYLSQVINESLRLRPALAVHARLATRPTSLPCGGGPTGDQPISISKGTFVVYSNYALHRDPLVFGADVDSFRPERWEGICPERWEYLNWGAGPRLCPGKRMGWVVMAYAVVRVVGEIEGMMPADENEGWEEERAFSFGNRNGCMVVVKGGERGEV